jgi:hypothetical protein
MRDFILDLTKILTPLCPTFLHVPPETPYPHISIEPLQSLMGVPWGPTVITLAIKIWSQYAGTKEILNLAKEVERVLRHYNKANIKISESSLALSNDGTTRVHTIRIKAKVEAHE